MDLVFAQIRTELATNDNLRQAQALLVVLQHAAGGKDISSIASAVCDEIIASPASAVCKKLAFDLIRCTRLTGDQWEVVCRGIQNDFDFPDSDVTAAAVSFLSAIPSWRLSKFVIDSSKEISNCIVHDNPNLRYAIIETLGCLLARDDVVNLCVTSAALLDRVSGWWRQIGESMLHPSDAVTSQLLPLSQSSIQAAPIEAAPASHDREEARAWRIIACNQSPAVAEEKTSQNYSNSLLVRNLGFAFLDSRSARTEAGTVARCGHLKVAPEENLAGFILCVIGKRTRLRSAVLRCRLVGEFRRTVAGLARVRSV